MKDQIEQKFEELSLLLVMIDRNDQSGLDIVKLQLADIEKLLAASVDHPRLAKEYSVVKENLIKLVQSPDVYDAISSFTALAQNYFRNPTSTVFSAEKDSSKESLDLGDFFDPEFLPEFIEKHNLLLQDLEGAVLDFRFKTDNADHETTGPEFEKFTKSYLHSIKGDAGSIGLIGIEQATHYFEDLIAKHTAVHLLDELIAYKEWVSGCLQCYAGNAPLKERAATFIARLGDLAATNKLASSPTPTNTSEKLDSNTGPHNTHSYKISADAELITEFFVGAEDYLNNIEALLLDKVDDYSIDDIDTLFRAIHSIKGASSYFNLIEINKTSHALENLLDEVRNGKRKLDDKLKQLTLRYIDLQRRLINSARVALKTDQQLAYTDNCVEFLFHLCAFREQNLEALDSVILTTSDEEEGDDDDSLLEQSSDVDDKQPESKDRIVRTKDKLGLKTYVKIDTDRLDRLVEAIGEMVIYSSMLTQHARTLLGDNETILKTTHQVEKFSHDLQEIGMSMRLDPIKGLFQKMSRLVWDISKKLHKEITITTAGEDTELDRTVIEQLADPLMHMIRNAVDHGIESATERLANGKPAAGCIHLEACHSGGNIVITVSDDGRGLDAAKIISKAREKGIISDHAVLSEQETYNLIFHSGFTTVDKVTDISGRGVGMDVVRSNIEGMRGQVRIQSQLGQGTKFIIELPLTLAIIEGIEIIVGAEHFILPTLSILEFMKPVPEMVSSTVGQLENFLFRGKFLPLFRISELYDITPRYTEISDGIVVIVENGNEQIALFIDDIMGTCQTVIKTLGSMFAEGQGLAGCAIMPDGDIGLILDVRSLTQLARTNYVRGTVLKSLADRQQTMDQVLNHKGA